jgi:DNA-binding MarR family transcriptional regulator
MPAMANATHDVVARLHEFGMARDRLRTAMAGLMGIGLTDLDALEYLERFGPMTQRALGARLLLTSGATTMLVDRLESVGLVRRGPHPTDRRALLVIPEAQKALPRLPEMEGYHQALAAASAALSDRSAQQLAGFLHDAAAKATGAADEMRARTPIRTRR